MAIYTAPSAGQTISGLYTEINASLEAVMSCQYGSTEPTVKPTGCLWWDTATAYLRRWDGSVWRNILPISTSTVLMADGTTAMSGALAMGSNRITGLAAPTADADAATKLYVDDEIASAVSGVDPNLGTGSYSVFFASSANQTLTASVSPAADYVDLFLSMSGGVIASGTFTVRRTRVLLPTGGTGNEVLVLDHVFGGQTTKVYASVSGATLSLRMEVNVTSILALTISGNYKAVSF